MGFGDYFDRASQDMRDLGFSFSQGRVLTFNKPDVYVVYTPVEGHVAAGSKGCICTTFKIKACTVHFVSEKSSCMAGGRKQQEQEEECPGWHWWRWQHESFRRRWQLRGLCWRLLQVSHGLQERQRLNVAKTVRAAIAGNIVGFYHLGSVASGQHG